MSDDLTEQPARLPLGALLDLLDQVAEEIDDPYDSDLTDSMRCVLRDAVREAIDRLRETATA